MEKPTIKSIILVFGIFIMIFIAWLVIGSIGFYKAVASKNWPTSAGTVISSEVVRPSGKSTKFEAKVVFTYSVDGKAYTSEKLKATMARGTSSWAREVVESYPAGAKVEVYFNPKNPGTAVVLPGLQRDNYWMTLLPLFVLLLIIKVFVDQIKNARKTLLQETNA